MAQILPVNTSLGDIQEGGAVDLTFTAQLDATDTLKSINIIDYQPTSGIIVEGSRYYGNYNSVFSFGADALKYREGDELKTAATWEDLPPPKTADLYMWRAPSSLQRTFTYTVECIYDYQSEESSGGSGESGGTTTPPVERRITKTYTQLVYGNWSRWGNKLREYVYAGN
ncbi:hypothetical protein ACQ31_gp208 [Salmonella phage STML-198]|uniref:Uncharacterized protein n=2 Tax=Gelderlandvirus TaxID=1913653 RepID=K4I298_9CAUD|nr:hypothetical protein ACQ31_gp208 [Salmonella phage STML-198]YP_009615628.1 hypothetical protein FDI73_gp248 [Salmonella phage Melville]AFU64091.1 hypothetical protein [Salmonella phage STML-198]ATN93116.1 hypothetical protein CPT_Melville_153 [Salmonella phage Melville]UPW42513.1 hypothetical protein EBPHNEJP_00226 [Salmonella phage CF-SP2]